jgi:ankyrin repeat protein
VALLLDQGADVNARNGRYNNALQAASASRGSCKEVVALLLDKGADVNMYGGFYKSALHAAACFGHKEIVALLLDKGADFGNVLQTASARPIEEIMEALQKQSEAGTSK